MLSHAWLRASGLAGESHANCCPQLTAASSEQQQQQQQLVLYTYGNTHDWALLLLGRTTAAVVVVVYISCDCWCWTLFQRRAASAIVSARLCCCCCDSFCSAVVGSSSNSSSSKSADNSMVACRIELACREIVLLVWGIIKENHHRKWTCKGVVQHNFVLFFFFFFFFLHTLRPLQIIPDNDNNGTGPVYIKETPHRRRVFLCAMIVSLLIKLSLPPTPLHSTLLSSNVVIRYRPSTS